MAKRKKRVTSHKTKSKKKKKKTKAAKKSVKRAVSKKSRRTAKKVVAKKSRKPVSRRKRVVSRKPELVPVVEGEIIDVVDEPVPGVVRVTEIETTRVTVPDTDDDEE